MKNKLIENRNYGTSLTPCIVRTKLHCMAVIFMCIRLIIQGIKKVGFQSEELCLLAGIEESEIRAIYKVQATF